jgi:hypothetical protein
LQITRYTSLSEMQFLGCASAFLDSIFGELNAAVLSLRKLEGKPKGVAFAFEMSLDTHRYGALLILERWAELTHNFGAHVALSHHQGIIDQARGHVETAEGILQQINQVLDTASDYTGEVVAACVMGFQSLNLTFEEEKKAVDGTLRLDALLPKEFHETRRIFLADLAAR